MTFRNSMKQIMLKKIFNAIVALFATGTAVAGQTNLEPLKVLFIGNSYTHMNDMPSMFEKISKEAGMNVLVEKCAQSSATFQIHAEERPEIYEAIKSRKWDYVILQGFSREMAFEPTELDTTVIPYIDKLIRAIYENNACTNVMFYMTWGYKNGYSHRKETDSYDKMTAKIETGYSYVGHFYDLPVVPVGLVWKQQRKNNPNINLYARDLAHPSKNGSYLVACTFFKAIFGTEGKIDHSRIIRKKYSEEIQDAIDHVLALNREKYDLDRYLIDVEMNPVEDEKGEIRYKLTYKVNHKKNVKAVAFRTEEGDTQEGFEGAFYFYDNVARPIYFDVTNDCNHVTTQIRRIGFEGVVPKRRKEDEI